MRASSWPLAVLLVIQILAGCGKSESAREEEAARKAIPERLQADGTIRLSVSDREALGLVSKSAPEGELAEVALRYGKILVPPRDELIITPPVKGRIEAPPTVRLGEDVKAGTAILEIVAVRPAQLMGEVESARHDLTFRQAEAARLRPLAALKAVSETKLQEAENALAQTRARLEALERMSRVEGGDSGGHITLRTPIAGTVTALTAEVGAEVQPGDVLARISRSGPRWVDVAVPPEETSGRSYEVAIGSRWVAASLFAKGALVQPDGARRDRLMVEEAQAAGLLSGQTVAVRVAAEAARGVIVPETALVPMATGDLVYVETLPNVFMPRPVQVAARYEGKARLSEGIRPGDQVVVKGAMALRGESLRSRVP